MKKFFALLLALVMVTALLTGCSNPVYDDLENFLNVEMTEVSENYTKITAEAGKWEAFEDMSQLETSIKDVLLPLVEDSLTKLEAVNPATGEVKEIKAKYVKVMEAYKEGFALVLDGVQKENAEIIEAGNVKINEGLVFLEEYNEALEATAKEVGAEIEY